MPLFQDRVRSYIRVATDNRLFIYGLISTLSVALVVFNAFKSYNNFYSVAVYLSRSNRSVMALANFGVLCSLLVGRGLQQVFFGSLRATEVERLYDKIWFFLTESLFAFTIFRDEFDVSFGIMFGFLLFVKCFHWLMAFRLEWMDQIQYPGPNAWFHIRINVLFMALWLVNIVMLSFALDNIMTHGVTGTVLFASEYAILVASLFNSIAKYLIFVYDIRRARYNGGENAPIWEDKSMYVFYIELITDFLKLITYLTFFLVVMTFYGLPLNIIRDIYVTARSFFQRCRDLVRYRTATRNMDERYPNATEEELTRMNDRTCIICREEMVARTPAQIAERPAGVNDTPKKLPCGHVFHFHCLRSWLERQQSCPTCRRTVFETPAAAPQNAQGQPRPPLPAPQNPLPRQDGAQPRGQGLLARWLGGAGMAPPLVPGQFAPGPGGLNPQQPFGPPFNQGFPVQNPFGPWQPPAQQQVPPPVQVLQGFYIGNQWQPWDQPPPQEQQPLPARNPAASEGTPEPAQVQPTPTRPPAPDNASSTSTPLNTPPPAESRNNPATINSIDSTVPELKGQTESSDAAHTPTPKEAAAMAALRRLDSTSSGSSNSKPSGVTSTPKEVNMSQAGSSEQGTSTDSTSDSTGAQPSLGLPPRPPSSIPVRQPVSTPTARQAPQNFTFPEAPRRQRGAVPSLIPLFDPATTQATIVAPPNVPNNRTYVNIPYLNQTLRQQPFTGGPWVDIRTLPRTLTQEQLNRLDDVTREAIDERLRVLENVQATLWRCSDELMRVRSTLPARPGTAQTGGETSSSSGTSSGETGLASSSSSGSSSATTSQAVNTSPTGSASSSDSVVPTAVAVEPAVNDNNSG